MRAQTADNYTTYMSNIIKNNVQVNVIILEAIFNIWTLPIKTKFSILIVRISNNFFIGVPINIRLSDLLNLKNTNA